MAPSKTKALTTDESGRWSGTDVSPEGSCHWLTVARKSSRAGEVWQLRGWPSYRASHTVCGALAARLASSLPCRRVGGEEVVDVGNGFAG